MRPAVVERAEDALGRSATSWSALQSRVAGSTERWLVRFEDGGTAFVKGAFDEADSADWLRTEHLVYSGVEASFMPRLLGWVDAARPVLVLEDLSDAVWPPPWSPELVDGVLATLDRIAATKPPPGLPRLETLREPLAGGWRTIADDPEPFLSIGLCSRAWLDSALPAVLAAADAAVLEGDALVHVDVRSDNLCVRDGRTILVDWNQAAVGNPLFDVVEWLPSLALEGGPSPGQILAPPEGVELASLLAGFWACRAGLPPPPTAPLVRELQRGQVEVMLPWLAESLGLPPPDGSALRSRG